MSKKAYEVVLPGFDGSDESTGHLLKWVRASNQKTVQRHYPQAAVHPLDILDPPSSCIDKELP